MSLPQARLPGTRWREGTGDPTARMVLGAAAAAWVALVVQWRGSDAPGTGVTHHGVAVAPDPDVVSPADPAWLLAWLLMVIAMMWPLVVPTVGAVYRSGFRHWRVGLALACLATVTLLWLVVGLAAGAVARWLGIAHGSVRWQLTFVCLALIAFGSARRRRLLERCLRLPALAPGGRRGVTTAARAGALTWRRCALLCGPLMLAMSVGHSLALMAGASAAAWWESWHPRAWRDPVPVLVVAAAGLWVLWIAVTGGGGHG